MLGPRLLERTQLICATEGKTIHEILGSPDDMKFRSCMTLFSRAAEKTGLFEEALQKFFSGEPDVLTLARIETTSRRALLMSVELQIDE